MCTTTQSVLQAYYSTVYTIRLFYNGLSKKKAQFDKPNTSSNVYLAANKR